MDPVVYWVLLRLWKPSCPLGQLIRHGPGLSSLSLGPAGAVAAVGGAGKEVSRAVGRSLGLQPP